jgi:formylglycine-generating enzyme required for sulfatase activity
VIDDLDAVIKLSPHQTAFRLRGIAHARLGHKEQARVDLEKFRTAEKNDSMKPYAAVVVAAELDEGTNKVAEALEASLKKQPQDAILHYNAACAYSIASRALAGKDQAKSEWYSKRAVVLLRAAIQKGYTDYGQMREDADLDPLRKLPAFAEVMKAGQMDRQYRAVWTNDDRFEASPLIGLDPGVHPQRCRELARQGYRVIALSVALASSEKPPISASVWHRPVDEVQDRLAERQARAAIALSRMGRFQDVMPLLRHSANPRLRSFIINWLNPLGVDPKLIAAELDRIDPNATPMPAPGQHKMDAILFHPETSQRRALILAMGTYGLEGLSPGEREPLVGKLLDLYRNDPDSGLHGACAWTLRQWEQQQKLQAADADLIKLRDRGNRRWFVNTQGQTFTVIDAPLEFRAGGSRKRESDWDSVFVDETPYHRVIPRRFAIATQEVANEPSKGPTNWISWYGAAAYCNGLSRQERLSECYEPNSEGVYGSGMKVKPDALRLNGYRLPTEAEWEYACRAGAATVRYYGATEDLLGRYAWCLTTAHDQVCPCGSLLPNDLGLFDTLGNVDEWCQNVPRLGNNERDPDDTVASTSVTDKYACSSRGGYYSDHPTTIRPATRRRMPPNARTAGTGFRLARTLP